MQNKKVVYICIWFLFIMYLFSFLLTTSTDFTQDLGRHLLLGQIIVQTKAVPKINLISYTYPHFPFINHHWFSEVILFICQKGMGLNSLIILKACVICLAIVIAVIASGSVLGVGTAFLFSPLILERADIRPEIFGFLAFSLLLMQLRTVQKTKRISFYVPFIFLLWVNIHISFVLGLFLLGALFLEAQKSKRNILVCVLNIACLFINPNGIRGVLAPLTIFSNYGYSIVENQNMFFLSTVMKDIFIRGYFLSLPLVIAVICTLTFRKKYIQVFLLLVFTGLAMYQVRHLPFFVLTAIAFIPAALVEISRGVKPSVRLLFSYLFIYFLLAGILFFGSNMFFETFDINKSFGLGYEMRDTKVVSVLKENKGEGNIFNNFDIGSYLSYRLFPEMKVFVDGRPEAYPASFFQNDYIPLEENQDKQDAIFKQYNIHTVVISHTDQTPWGDMFLARILKNKQWKLVFVDPVFAVFSDGGKAIDIRNTDIFRRQINEERDFFHTIQYAHFLGAMGGGNQYDQLIQKAMMLRPDSCLIIRMRQTQFSAPWCQF